MKNSWKYEKDLIIIFNSDLGYGAIRQVGNSTLVKWVILITTTHDLKLNHALLIFMFLLGRYAQPTDPNLRTI